MAVYGRPVPQIEAGGSAEEALQGAVGFGYIDDFGLMAVGPAQAAREAAETWSQRTTEGMKDKKLDVHKVQVGEGLPAALGATITGRPYVLRIMREKAVLLRAATLHLLALPKV